jgi:hypothetical protein
MAYVWAAEVVLAGEGKNENGVKEKFPSVGASARYSISPSAVERTDEVRLRRAVPMDAVSVAEPRATEADATEEIPEAVDVDEVLELVEVERGVARTMAEDAEREEKDDAAERMRWLNAASAGGGWMIWRAGAGGDDESNDELGEDESDEW